MQFSNAGTNQAEIERAIHENSVDLYVSLGIFKLVPKYLEWRQSNKVECMHVDNVMHCNACMHAVGSLQIA